MASKDFNINKNCTIQGCENKSFARTWCMKHYKRWKRNGDQEKLVIPRGSLKERFYTKFVPVTESGCWIWIANVNHKGYGFIKENHTLKNRTAHRVSYELHVGVIPSGMHVLHHCDVPSCVNPSHIFLGTNQDNVDDKIKKRRQRHLSNEEHPNSKLADKECIEIRDLYPMKTQAELALLYKVTQSCIHLIVSNKSRCL